MADLIQLRRDTAANWTSANPTLSQGEQGYETDTGKMKIGDGSTAWTSLDYFVDSSAYATSSDITSAVATKANTADLATVATSGSYDDLSDQPTIPSIDGLATETYVDTAVSNLVGAAPGTLDTLNELAAALGDDADFATTTATSIGLKANTADLATVATTGAYSDLTGTPTIPAALTDLSITDGTAGQVLSADGDGTYTFIDAASGGGGGGSFEAVASGSLSDGSTSILNADGTVSAVGVVESPGSLGTNYSSGPDGAGYEQQISMYDSTSGKTVIVANGAYPSYIGTISLTTFNSNGSSSYTPISLPSGFDNAEGTLVELVSIGNGKFVLVYYSNANSDTRTVVGTISGDNITWGTAYVVTSGYVSNCALIYYASEDKVILLGGGNFRVGTVSGTDITFEAPTATPSSSSGTLAYFPNRSKAVYIWSSSPNIALKTFTLDSSGNITLGSTVLSDSIGMAINAAPRQASFYHTGLNKFVFIGFNDSNRYIVSVVVDIDENGLAVVYTPKTIHSGNPQPTYVGAAYDPNINTYVVYWMSNNGDNGPSEVLHIKEATIDSNTYAITTGSLIVSLSNTKNGISKGLYIPEIQKTLIMFGTTTGRRAAVWTFTQQVSNLTAENYAGIADAAYADAATATIKTAGSVDDAQSGLTPGQAYYVQGNGTLGLNPATPSVFAGTAVSATSLLIGKEGPASTVAYADVTGTPTLATVATSGAYADITGTPTLPADVSDLTDNTSLLGGGGGSFEAVASGTLANGDIVIVNADGTVSVVAEVGVTEGFGDITDNYSSVSLSNSHVVSSLGGKVVVVYPDNGNSTYGTAVVGTISGKSVSFGTPVVFENSATNTVVLVEITSTNKIAIFYKSDNRYAIVGTVSGSSISFGSKTTISAEGVSNLTGWYDPISDRIAVFYRTTHVYAEIYSVSGTSITKVSTATVNSQGDYSDNVNSIYDTNSNQFVTFYMWRSGSNFYTRYKIGTISGNSISFGAETDFGTYRFGAPLRAAATDTRTIYVWTNSASSGGAGNSYLQMRIGYVNGSTISHGTTYTVSSAQVNSDPRVAYDSTNNKGIILWSQYDGSSWTGRYIIFTLTGDTTASFGSSTLNPSGGSFWSMSDTNFLFDANIGRIIITYLNNLQIYQTTTLNETNLTAENYIGISDAAYSDGATATVQIVGSVDDAQSGLTPGQAYYVQTDGTLSTTADDPSVFAGTAVAATKLIVKG